jgi:hypothetical protein
MQSMGLWVLMIGVCITSPAWAGEITTTRTGNNGKTSTSNTTVTRDGNTVTRSTTTTYGDGTTSSSTGVRTYNQDGTFSGQVTHTNRKGEVNTGTVSGTRTRDGNTVSKTVTMTGTDGKQVNFNNQRSCSAHQCQGSRTHTNAQGRQRSVTVTGNRNGNTLTYSPA